MATMIERFIGGEEGKRGFFGGRSSSTSRKVVLVSVIVVGAVVTLRFGLKGLVASGAVFGLAWLVTLRTGGSAGSVLERKARDRRESQRTKSGQDMFRPVHQRPAQLSEPVTGGRKAKLERYREWNSYRDWPDGLVGLQWLQEGSPAVAAVPSTDSRPARAGRAHVPGIAWHVVPGQTQYLSVIFPVGGQVRGMEPDRMVNQYATRFGQVMTASGAREAKGRRFQFLTRVLPPDSAEHEQWAANNLDAVVQDSNRELVISYAEVVGQLTRRGYVQRHFVVARWDLTAEFTRAAARRGPGGRGWIALMDAEIDSVRRRLVRAGMSPGEPLTARQSAAVFRHQQMPSWPIDQAGDIENPMTAFLAEQSFHDHTVVTDAGPDGQQQQWWHRTARVPIEAVETGPRTPLWLLPLLTGVSTNIVRTVSIEAEVIPAQQARRDAKDDLATDMASLYKAEKEGAMADEELKVAKRAVEARTRDLEPGSGHHGVQWCMHVTISAPSRAGLVDAVEVITEAADNSGINELAWLDGWGQAAHGATFPICRALKPYKRRKSADVMDALAGRGRKDSLR